MTPSNSLCTLIFTIFGLALTLPAAFSADPTVRFTDQAVRLRLHQTKQHYQVLFQDHSALYQVENEKKIVACLMSSAEKRTRVKLEVHPHKMQILSCQN